jgi:tetratricopeptide (TPR) repeat protein
MRAPVERVALSPFFARALDRYLRAEILERLGREEEAMRWYRSLVEGPDLLFRAAAHHRLGELLQRAGKADEARRHQERFQALWRGNAPAHSTLGATAGEPTRGG